MSAAASPGPKNLLLLAALGIGVYWFMTRSANARTLLPAGMMPAQGQPATWQKNDNALWLGVANILGSTVPKLFSNTTPTVYQQQNGAVAAQQNAGSGYSSPTGDPYSTDSWGGVDSAPIVNPPGNEAAYDWWNGNSGMGD